MYCNYLMKISEHYSKIWNNTSINHIWNIGPLGELPQGFKILRFKSTKTRNMWTYCSCGMSLPTDDIPLELHIFSPDRKDCLVELITAIAHYYRTSSRLGTGDTIIFGQP
jgi:hypothetical protein